MLSKVTMNKIEPNDDISAELVSRQPVVEKYIENCLKYQIEIDPSIVISLLTGWKKLQPTKRFSEGAMITLMDIIETNPHIKRLDLGSLTNNNSTYRGAGAGNSNARILNFILRKNTTIESLDLSNTGLDDDGIGEISKGIARNASITELNISANHFGEIGAERLKKALIKNKGIKVLDLSRNALGYNSINSLLCVCNPKGMLVKTAGNFVFEEILNSVSHGVAFLASIVGSIVLLRDVADDQKFTDYHFWACFLYSFSLMFLFICSCLYHSFFMLPTPSRILQILDHTGIYYLIAGSYTPFLLIAMHHHVSSRILLTSQWVTAFFGTIFSACADFNSKYTTLVELVIFLVMGLGVMFVMDEIMVVLNYPALLLLVLGGAAYIFGIVFFILGEYRPIYHTVWHMFVVLGAALHWFDIYFFIIRTDLGAQAAINIGNIKDAVGAASASASANIMETVESIRELL